MLELFGVDECPPETLDQPSGDEYLRHLHLLTVNVHEIISVFYVRAVKTS